MKCIFQIQNENEAELFDEIADRLVLKHNDLKEKQKHIPASMQAINKISKIQETRAVTDNLLVTGNQSMFFGAGIGQLLVIPKNAKPGLKNWIRLVRQALINESLLIADRPMHPDEATQIFQATTKLTTKQISACQESYRKQVVGKVNHYVITRAPINNNNFCYENFPTCCETFPVWCETILVCLVF